jgi:two-component system, NtrC family, response regulator AtoC
VKILVVDDQQSIRFAVRELLADAGHSVREAEHAPAALAALEGDSADLVISDLNMPAMNGLALLEEVRARHPGTLFIMLTAHGDERIAVEALKLGAWHYIPKPFDNDELTAVVERAREFLALRHENQRLRAELAGSTGGIIGRAPALREGLRILDRVAPLDVTVLITGESGTGKEVFARALHDASPRQRAAFIAINCAALPGELIESELFGHARGAFTGADRDRDGVFAAADGGTLFLDEVGELSAPAQAKLLRVLEERTITPVGSTQSRAVDVRLIAATNRSLDVMARDGTFREDLLWRLSVVQLQLPPLRERREDIAALAAHFIAHFAERHGRPALPLDEAARRTLLAYDWPGNVRELRNALERAGTLAAAREIRVEDLPPRVRDADPAALPVADASRRNLPLRDLERAYILEVLRQNNGNKSRAAEILGLDRKTLYRKLGEIGEIRET